MGHHVTPIRTYVLIFVGLLVLTGVTIYTALSPIGNLHMPVAMSIAILKAALVVLFFMHALTSGKLTWIVIMASLFMLGVLLLMTMSDYTTRYLALG
jgi:cytochrome c oxidase subunit 4